MYYKLGLMLYGLGGRAAQLPPTDRPQPSDRPRVWLHVPSADSLAQMAAISRRLEDEGVAVMMTSSAALESLTLPDDIYLIPAPADQREAVAAFLDHWQPDLVVFSDGELRPLLINAARARGLPLFMINARAPQFLKGRDGWWPGLMKGLLAEFEEIHVLEAQAERAFRKGGASERQLRVMGRLEYPSAVIPYNEAERTALATLLATRPVWFAADLPPSEEAVVLQAHQGGLRLAHRLLLILAPADEAQASALIEQMEQQFGWIIARRDLDEEPDDECQVYLVDPNEEFGLWYRLAPITFSGGSLFGSGAHRDPMEAAALGSALIHGPKAGKHGFGLGRLAGAQATSLVGTGAELTEALGRMIEPEQSARHARAAWDVASQGVEASQAALDMILHALDRAPAR